MGSFNVNSILNEASQAAQAGPRLEVVMVPHGDIRPNPENQKIYIVGDVSALKADIAANGLRQPLEVIPAGDGKYTLIGGERRWTACGQLLAEGDDRFARLPCILRQSQGADEDLLALITANSTARELTDGERLAQYEALKGVLERKKAAGTLEGRVRAAMTETTGQSSGALGRLNAVSANCTEEVKQMLRDGKTTLAKAYEASKLWKVQQAGYCQKGYAPSLPWMTKEEKAEIFTWIIEEGLKDLVKDVDWSLNYYDEKGGKRIDLGKFKGTVVKLPGGTYMLRGNDYSMNAFVLQGEDAGDARRRESFHRSDLWAPAKEIYQSKEQAKAERAAARARAKEADAAVLKRKEKQKREDALNDAVKQLMAGDLPGQWKQMQHMALLHMTSYSLELPDGTILLMLVPDYDNDPNKRMFMRLHISDRVIAMDYDEKGCGTGRGWVTAGGYYADRDIRRALMPVAARLTGIPLDTDD